MKKYLYSASLGVTIGTMISLIMSACFGQGTYLPLNPHSTMGQYYMQHLDCVRIMALSVLIWAMIGILFQAADTIFKQDWSLVKMTMSHFLITAVGFTFLAILAGWFPLNGLWLFLLELIFTLIYGAIFWVNYRAMREQIGIINQGLKK